MSERYPDETAPPPKPPPRDKRKRSNPLLRAALILGGLLLVVALSVPFVIGSVGGRVVGFYRIGSNTFTKIDIANVARPYTLAKDSTITPMRAGIAMASLSATAPDSLFGVNPEVKAIVPPWVDEEITPDMFTTARPQEDKKLPGSEKILAAARGKLSADEMDLLERIAHAPLWREYELVGRAPLIDVLGGRFKLPFPDTVAFFEMPLQKFAGTKGLAYAGVSRAAYYLARNQRDSAEAALFAVNSFGFAMSDNATNLIEALIGSVIVGIGRHALEQFYTITGDPRGKALAASADSVRLAIEKRPKNGTTGRATREELIALAGAKSTPRLQRLELLTQLAAVPCMSARGLLFGADANLDSVFASARRDLARFPSERALVDHIQALPNRPLRGTNSDTPGLVVAAASLSSTLLRSQRLLTCTKLFTMMR